MKTGGGPGGGGGGGQGALGAAEGSNREAGAMGPWGEGESHIIETNVTFWVCELFMRETTEVTGVHG